MIQKKILPQFGMHTVFGWKEVCSKWFHSRRYQGDGHGHVGTDFFQPAVKCLTLTSHFWFMQYLLKGRSPWMVPAMSSSNHPQTMEEARGRAISIVVSACMLSGCIPGQVLKSMPIRGAIRSLVGWLGHWSALIGHRSAWLGHWSALIGHRSA